MSPSDFTAFFNRLKAIFPDTFPETLRTARESIWEELPGDLTVSEGEAIVSAVLTAGYERFPSVSQIYAILLTVRRDRPQAPVGRAYRANDLDDIAPEYPKLVERLYALEQDRKDKIRVGPVRDKRTGDTGPPSRTPAENLILHRWAEVQEAIARYRAGEKPRVPIRHRPESDSEWFKLLDELLPDARPILDQFQPMSEERIQIWRTLEQFRLGLTSNDDPWPMPKTESGRNVAELVRKGGKRAFDAVVRSAS